MVACKGFFIRCFLGEGSVTKRYVDYQLSLTGHGCPHRKVPEGVLDAI